MLIRELILHHVGDGAVHQRGYALPETQTAGLQLHPLGAPIEPESGDLLLLGVAADGRLAEAVGDHLPLGTAVVLLIPTEPARLPVGRVVNELVGSGLKLVEAFVLSGMQQPTVAVVARRSDEVLLPPPSLARALEPVNDAATERSAGALTRILAESVLQNLAQRARERELLADLGAAEDRCRKLERAYESLEVLPAELTAVKAERSALKTERKALKTERNALRAERNALRVERNALRREGNALKKRLTRVEASTSYRLARKIARGSERIRRLVPGRGE
jgi:FtsZ-binding cell division protein ZapB